MPELSRFYGIIIRMYFTDHAPPHFHATYQGEEGIVEIDNLAIVRGRLPARAHGLVVEWASLHQQECEKLGSAGNVRSHPELSSRCRRLFRHS